MLDKTASATIYVDAAGDHVKEMPLWAAFLMSVGKRLAENKSTTHRSTIVIVLPIRNFAAPLIAAGITLRRASESVETSDLQAHFDHLCDQPAGKKVIYTSGNIQYKGILESCEGAGEAKGLRIKISKRYETVIVVFKSKSGGVELAEWEGPLSERISARKMARRPGFLDAMLGAVDSRDFVTKSRLDAVLIGNAYLLTEEINNDLIWAESAGVFHEGKFSDLLRVKRYDLLCGC